MPSYNWRVICQDKKVINIPVTWHTWKQIMEDFVKSEIRISQTDTEQANMSLEVLVMQV